MSKLINELITILSATNQLLEVEQRQAKNKLEMAAMYDGNNAEIAANLRAEALEHQQRAENYYQSIKLISDRIYGEKEVVKLNIVDENGNRLSKRPSSVITPEIKDEKIKEVAEQIKNNEIQYPERDANIAVYQAMQNEGIESAMKKVEYFFSDLVELRCKADKKTMDDKIAANPDDDTVAANAKALFESRRAKIIRTIAKDKNRKGQLEYVKACKERVLEEANPGRTIVVQKPEDILSTKYWLDGKFNYKVFDGGSEDKTEDLLKLEVVHKHALGKKDEAVALVRTYYKDKNWDTLEAQQFVYALMNEKNAHEDAKNAAKGFILNGLMEQQKKSGKAAKNAYKTGIQQGKKFLKAWFRTDDVDDKGQPIYMVDDEKLNKMLDEIIAQAKVELSGAA